MAAVCWLRPLFSAWPSRKNGTGRDHARETSADKILAGTRRFNRENEEASDTRGADASWSGARGRSGGGAAYLSRRAAFDGRAGVHDFLGSGLAGCGEWRGDGEDESILRLHSDEFA